MIEFNLQIVLKAINSVKRCVDCTNLANQLKTEKCSRIVRAGLEKLKNKLAPLKKEK